MGLLSAQYEYLRKVGDSRKILICAPSNAAVDHITRRLAQEGLINGEGETFLPNIIRAGIVETQDQAIREVSLDYLCEKIVLDNNEAARKISQMTTAEMKDRMMVLEKELKKRGITEEESKAKRQ